MKAEKESDILRTCLKYLQIVRRWMVWRNQTGALPAVGGRFIRFGQVGSADILGVLPAGRALAVETKRPGNKPTSHQAAWLAEFSRAGGLALVVTSLDDLRRQLAEAGYSEE